MGLVGFQGQGLVNFQGQGLVGFQGQGLGSFGGFSNLEASVDFLPHT